MPDPPVPNRWSNFSPHEKRLSREEEDGIVSELSKTGRCDAWIGRLKFSDSPDVPRLLMTIGDRYKLPVASDATTNGCIEALCGIYERTRQGYIRDYLLRAYSMWDSHAKSLLLLDYPFGEEIIEQLRSGISDPAYEGLRQAAIQRISNQPEIWNNLRADVYSRLDVEADPDTRLFLQQAKTAMETPR